MHLDTDLEKKLSQVKNYTELLQVALWWLEKNEYDTFVCGPIFSDGTDKIAENLIRLEDIIKKLENQNIKVFNQIPFLDINLAQETQIKHFETRVKFDEFYHPLFQSGFIKTVYMMPNWERSQGSIWEHEFAKNNEIDIIYL